MERTLAGRYRLISHLARGGMADVFEAEDQLLQRKVAVKVLHPQIAMDGAFVQRFRREAQAAANLSHPNIVSIYDSGQQGETHFIVMELIAGRTLREVLKSNGPLLPRRAAEIASEVAAALEVAHGAGVIHRDLKPGNIMLASDGTVKVTDFSIAKALDDSEELTKTGAVIGTATYFSPEQAQGVPADQRSDLYSLGVVLYEMLAGITPFGGDSPVAVAYQHVSEFADPPSALNREVPAELDAIVMKALEKDPAARFQTTAEIRSDLLRYLRGEVPMAPEAAAVAVAAPADAATRLMESPPATVPPEETARHVAQAARVEGPHSQSLFFVGVAALVVAVAIGIFLLVRILSGGSGLIDVPNVVGLGAEDARAELQSQDLRVQSSFRPSADVERDLVIDTDPPPGTGVEPDSFVTIIISSGPETAPILNLVGFSEEEARTLIEENGLVVGEVTFEAREDVEDGQVISQFPDPGTEVPPGTPVDLVISTGPDALTIPELRNQTEQNARFQLELAGFDLDQLTIVIDQESSAEVPEDFVVRSVPEAGQLLPKDGTITLFLSTGPGLVQVPIFIGRTVTEAQGIAEQFDLVIVVAEEPVPVQPGAGLENLIAAQDPQPETEVEPGSTVIVGIGEIPTAIVPDLDEMTEADAQAAVEALGLVFVVSGTIEVAPDEVGEVVDQNPVAGTELQVGQQVSVFIGEPTPTTTTTTTTTLAPTTTAES